MQFNIKQKYFLEALRMLSGVTEKNDSNKLNQQSNILISLSNKFLLLITNSKEIELKVKLKNLFIKKLGSASLNFNKLYSICKNFEKNDLILFKLIDSKIEMISFNSKYTLATYDASLFPLHSVEKIFDKNRIDKSIFKEMINKISFSMGIQDVRFFLNGMLLEFNKNKLTLISTDGYRLSKIDYFMDNKSKKKIIIPRQSVIELYKILSFCKEKEIVFYFGNSYLKINIGNFNYRTKLLSGDFPNYNSFIPKKNNKFLIVNSSLLKKIFLRISVLCNVKSNKIFLRCQKNKLTVKTLNFYKDSGVEEMFINYIGDQIDISFNIKYMMDILSKIDSDVIEISLYDSVSSAIFREVRNKKSYSSLYVLMPIRM